MKYSFKRRDEIGLQDFRKQIRQQYRALEWLKSGEIDSEEVVSCVQGIMDSGRSSKRMPDALFWGFDEPESIPGDIRVEYYYMPTYLNTAFLMQAYRMFPEKMDSISGFANALKRAMTASAGRRFAGDSYSKDDFVRGMMIFANINTKDFIRTHREIVPHEFSMYYCAAVRKIKRAVDNEEDYLAGLSEHWEHNHLEDYKKIIELENGTDERRILFVYGSLMEGQYNHAAYMGNSVFLGRGFIGGYALYDLGCYPGIRECRGKSRVIGELYEVEEKDFDRICELEGNGTLYQCEVVGVRCMDFDDMVLAETFVYLGKVRGVRRVPEGEQPWSGKRGEQI